MEIHWMAKNEVQNGLSNGTIFKEIGWQLTTVKFFKFNSDTSTMRSDEAPKLKEQAFSLGASSLLAGVVSSLYSRRLPRMTI